MNSLASMEELIMVDFMLGPIGIQVKNAKVLENLYHQTYSFDKRNIFGILFIYLFIFVCVFFEGLIYFQMF